MFEHLINRNYRHTFAVVVYTTGEVYTSSCDLPQYPLRQLYRRLDGLRREWKSDELLQAELINLNTGRILVKLGK